MKSIERNIDIRRYLNWSRIVKGKPIHIRLYELIYYELLIMWFEMNKPPLRRLIYETINSQDFEEKFVRGKAGHLLMSDGSIVSVSVRKKEELIHLLKSKI